MPLVAGNVGRVGAKAMRDRGVGRHGVSERSIAGRRDEGEPARITVE